MGKNKSSKDLHLSPQYKDLIFKGKNTKVLIFKGSVETFVEVDINNFGPVKRSNCETFWLCWN